MSRGPMVGAIIVAAGRGERVGADRPKQLLDLGGRSILQRSVAAFDSHPAVCHLVVVLPEELVADGPALIGPTRLECAVVAGGTRRQDSVANGVAASRADLDLLLVHDAARPFASGPLIDRVIAGAADAGASVPAIGVHDTVKLVDLAQSTVTSTVPREQVWLAQTPQGFRRQVLVNALRLGAQGASATDEAMLAELAGHAVRVVPGDEANVKITTREDLGAARSRVDPRPDMRVGTGYDLHRLVAGRPLVLAGVRLPFDRGPLGHSDGDVLCHALVDAIFGAAGAGDIGVHFPNTDARWKDAAGLDLLARGVAIVGESGWIVASADVTVVLERPKLSPSVVEIRERLARVLGVEPDRVSVKGKTNEGVDAVGRGEAIAAHAVAVIVRATGTSR